MGVLFCNFLGLMVKQYLKNKMHLKKNERDKNFFNLGLDLIVSKIYNESNVQIIVDLVKENLPIIYELNCSNLLTSDLKSLLNLEGATTFEGERYTTNIIQYPLKAGLTGRSLEEQKIICAINPSSKQKYNSQIDNINEIKRILNLTLIPLFNTKHEPLGVIQLINKKYENDESFIVQLFRIA